MGRPVSSLIRASHSSPLDMPGPREGGTGGAVCLVPGTFEYCGQTGLSGGFLHAVRGIQCQTEIFQRARAGQNEMAAAEYVIKRKLSMNHPTELRCGKIREEHSRERQPRQSPFSGAGYPCLKEGIRQRGWVVMPVQERSPERATAPPDVFHAV